MNYNEINSVQKCYGYIHTNIEYLSIDQVSDERHKWFSSWYENYIKFHFVVQKIYAYSQTH